MYNKPAPFNIGSPEELARAVGYSKQALAKVMQNPGSGVDQTLAVLAGMYIDRMKTGGMGAQAPTTTVKDDVMAAQPGGLQQASIPPEMFNSAVGEAPASYAAGGLVAFADGGEVGDPNWYGAEAYGDPSMPMATRRAGLRMKFPNASDAEIDRYLARAEKSRASKERVPIKTREGATLGNIGDTALAPVKAGLGAIGAGGQMVDEAAGNMRAVQEDPNRTGFQSDLAGIAESGLGAVQGAGRTIKGVADVTGRGLGAIGDYFTKPKGKRDEINMRDLPLPDRVVNMDDLPLPGRESVTDLPPMSSSDSAGGGQSTGVRYRGGAKPVNLNTDIEKEARNLRDTYDKLYPKTDEENKNAAYYGDEQVAQREKEQKHQDVWQSLMELGFGAAASNSPYWTQAWGESGKQMAPHVAAMMKARKDEKDAVQKARMAMAQADRARNDDEYKMAVQNVRAAQELQVQAQMKQEEISAQFAMNNARINAPKESDDLIRIWAADLIRQNPRMSETEAKAQAADKYWNYRSGQTKAENTAFRTSYDKFMSQLIKNKDMDKGYRQALKKGPAQAQKYLQDQATALARAEVSATDTTASDGATGFRYLGKE